MNINEIIRENVKTYRQHKKLTLQAMADKCNLTKSQVWEIENKKTSMSIHTLQKLSKGTGLSIAFLCGDIKYPMCNELLFSQFKNLSPNNKCIASKIMQLLKDWEF